MSSIHFYKYQATGNDFVVIDNRAGAYSFTEAQIQKICDRRFGIGADGLMLIEKHPTLDFNLQYYNSDGSQSLCGNGSRAAVKMASALGMVNGKTIFNAYVKRTTLLQELMADSEAGILRVDGIGESIGLADPFEDAIHRYDIE